MRRDFSVKYVASWVLCVLLAALFLIVGIPKILGGQNHWVRAFEMLRYPVWFRIVVGTVETVGAILLLVPVTTIYAACGLALLMIGATYSQLAVGQPGSAVVPALLFFVLLYVAWTRRPIPAGAVRRAPSAFLHRILHEGEVAGVIGATGVAVWFFIVDLIAGRPLFTPTVLGNALFSFFGPFADGESVLLHIIAYTIFHYAAFIAFGIILALVVNLAEEQPSILLGFFILFIAFEIGFHGMVAILQQSTILGALAWYQVMIGNLIASVLMVGYMFRTHPALGHEFAHALDFD
jgi:putative oxidoreductase